MHLLGLEFQEIRLLQGRKITTVRHRVESHPIKIAGDNGVARRAERFDSSVEQRAIEAFRFWMS